MCAKLDRTGLVADMTYVVFQGEAAAGRERCHLHRRAGGGYWLSADLDLASPFLHHEYIEVGTSSHWLPESLLVRLSGNVARDATFRPDGLALRATIVSDETMVEREVPWDADTYIETSSVCLYTLTFNRLEFLPEALSASADLNVVSIKLPSLEPVLVRRHYEYVGPESITTPAGDWVATHYIVSHTDHFWADTHGVVVAARRMIGGKLHDCKLLEYHRLS